MFTALCSITAMAQVPNYVPASGLVAWYPFNNNANDASVNGFNGTPTNVSYVADRYGNANAAVNFPNNNTTSNIDLGTGINPNQFSISLWFYKTNTRTGNFNVLLSKYATSIGFEIQFDGNNNFGFIVPNGTLNNALLSPTTTTPLSAWEHLVAVYDGNYAKMYLNNALVTGCLLVPTSNHGDSLYQPSYSAGNNPLTIGNRALGGYVFNWEGNIDDIGVWNRALTQQEITKLFQACTNSITAQPGNQTANVNTTAQFYVTSTNTSATYQWQQNSGTGFANLSNFGQFSGVTNDTLTISNVTLAQNNNGYRCIISGGCADTSNVAMLTVNNNVGVTEINNANSVSISPNPFTAQTVITFSNEQKNTTVKIIDVVGKEIKTQTFSGKQLIIEKGELNNGIYFVQITDENRNTIIKKIVVE